MNVAIINLKDLIKYLIEIVILVGIVCFFSYIIYNSSNGVIKKISINQEYLTKYFTYSTPILNYFQEEETDVVKRKNIINLQLAMFTEGAIQIEEMNNEITEVENDVVNIERNQEKIKEPEIIISKSVTTENVIEKNMSESSNVTYNTVKINNKSDYTLTEYMLQPDFELTNKKDVFIYHTHTCESYTPCDKYNYTMTGNYRTTDNNYNMIRVGKELNTYLTQKGFTVIHDGTYHDYPSYSGSYTRSLETAQNVLYGKNIELVFDLHRDAIGSGDTYGPTVKINGEKVAQLMFVIGTDGGGLEHPNWINNLKIAIKIQEKANEMYPGLFRPIILTNSRYNQHIATGASIIEVGATGNTLGECLLSMQCLANVLDEI